MVIWKCTDVFRGIFWFGEGVKKMGICRGNLEEFILGEENFHEGSAGFSSLFEKKQ